MKLRKYLETITRQANEDRQKCIEMWLEEFCGRQAKVGKTECNVWNHDIDSIKCREGERKASLEEVARVARRNGLNVTSFREYLIISWNSSDDDGDENEEDDENDDDDDNWDLDSEDWDDHEKEWDEDDNADEDDEKEWWDENE